MDQTPFDSGVIIYYDGECPLCRSYVSLVRLRAAAGPVTLVDLRTRPDMVASFRASGLDVNDGMVIETGGRRYFGGDGLHVLALLSSESGAVSRVCAMLFKNARAARVLYPALRAGRNTLLWLLGRKGF